VEAVTLLPHENVPLETPQLPLEVVIVKLLAVPENVYVASVWVDHGPADKRPPTVEPELTPVMVPLVGKLPAAPVVVVVAVVVVLVVVPVAVVTADPVFVG